jgi:2-hydroxychromene-2-carboxylate isomerase
MPAAKLRLNALDMHRWAARFEVPLVMPETHPNRTVLALRATLASPDVPAASKALFRAYWALGRDVSRREVVVEALDGAGLDGASLVARADEPPAKQALRDATDEATAAGVFGAPAFLVSAPRGEGDLERALFWGQDRLAMVERALGGTPPARPLGPTRGRELAFYFDFSSPFAYLAAAAIEGVAARTGARLVYRPLLLGALFRDIGTPDVPLFTMPEPKRRYYVTDMHRWAAERGAQLRFPSRFPMRTVKALRLLLAAPEVSWPALVPALFRAYWADDRDLSSEDVLAEVASSVGLDGRALVAAIEDPAIKARLRGATREAEERGLCGVPSFVVDGGEPFWGQDRLELVEEALTR